MTLLEEHNSWISTEEIAVLNHDLNYSNWVDQYACNGKWKINLSEDKVSNKTIEIYMPVSDWGKSHSGYWTVYTGRMELKGNELLIWQNDQSPTRLSYAENDSTISLWIYGRQIIFEKEK